MQVSKSFIRARIPTSSQISRRFFPLAITPLATKAFLQIGIQNIGKVNENEKSKYVSHPWLDGRLPSVPTISTELRILTFIAGNTAAGNMSKVARDWCFLPVESHHKGLEAIIHNLVFSGLPRTLNALSSVKKVGVAKAAILDPPHEFYSTKENNSGFATAEEAQHARVQRGIGIMKEYYGTKATRFRQSLRLLHPSIERFITEFVYGRIYSRRVLTNKESQLVMLACLSGQSLVPQFKRTIIQALRSGASVHDVRGILSQTYLVWGNAAQAVVDALLWDLNLPRLASKVERWMVADHLAKEEPNTTLPYVWDYDKNDNSDCTKLCCNVFRLQAQQSKPIIVRPLSQHPLANHFPVRPVDNVTDEFRLLILLAANTSGGNLMRVARDWGFLSPRYHCQGLAVMMESSIFGGLHKTISAIEVVREIGVDQSAIDYVADDNERMIFQKDHSLYAKRGGDLFNLIYKNTHENLRIHLKDLHPDVDTMIIEYAYGCIFSSSCPGIGPKEKELVAIACMTSGEIVFPQLHSHMLGALNSGATMNDIRAVLDMTDYLWGSRNQIIVDGFWLEFHRKYRRRMDKK